MEKSNDAPQEQPNYYGTGKRLEAEKSQLSLTVLLVALLLAVNVAALVIHASGGRTPAEEAEQDEGSLLPISATPPVEAEEDGLLGLRFSVFSPTQRRYLELPEGVFVQEVLENGPAAEAGMQSGDVIVAVQERCVTDAESYRAAVEACSAGGAAHVSVYRGGVYYDLELHP